MKIRIAAALTSAALVLGMLAGPVSAAPTCNPFSTATVARFDSVISGMTPFGAWVFVKENFGLNGGKTSWFSLSTPQKVSLLRLPC
jgi:hypothetical protein